MIKISAARALVPAGSIEQRVEAIDWQQVSHDLDAEGHAIIKGILSAMNPRRYPAFFRGTTFS